MASSRGRRSSTRRGVNQAASPASPPASESALEHPQQQQQESEASSSTGNKRKPGEQGEAGSSDKSESVAAGGSAGAASLGNSKGKQREVVSLKDDSSTAAAALSVETPARVTRSTRSRASTLTNGSLAVAPTPGPSAKSLGKRKALSPPAIEETPTTSGTPSLPLTKKRKTTSSAPSTPSTPPTYNLRPRGASGASSGTHTPTSRLSPANQVSDSDNSPSGKMPRKGKGAHSTSLRAKAAANAAIAAHNASSSNTQHGSSNANQSSSGTASPATASARRQRDPTFDTEGLIGLDDDDEDMDEDDDEDGGMDSLIEEEDADDAEEMRRAMELIRQAEEAELRDRSAASSGGPGTSNRSQEPKSVTDGQLERSVSPPSSDGLQDLSLLPIPTSEDRDDDDDEGRHDDDDDIEEDDEIGPGGDGDMLEDEFDAPLTFDADGNPLGPAEAHGAGSSTETGAPGAESDNGSGSGSSSGEGGFGDAGGRFSGHGASAGDDGFGSFAASLRGYSGLLAGMSGRLNTLLTGIRNKKDASARMVALQELSELLSMSTEDTLVGYFQVDAFVKELVSSLKGSGGASAQNAYGFGGDDMDDDFAMAQAIAASSDGIAVGGEENQEEMQLLACRCLANLIEAMPTTSHNIVSNGAVPVLCSKLFEITFIDLAEQTISTLEKLSEEVPSSIVREGGLSALLTYLDFFSTHVQRTALTAVAKCCSNLSIETFNSVRDAIPTLRNVLSYPDRKLVEQACFAITGIVESYRHHPDKLEILLTSDLLTAIAALLVPGSANSTIDSSTHPRILKLLSTAAKSSPEIAMSLIEMNIANTLYQLLTGVNPPMENEGVQGIKRHLEEDDMLVLNNLVHRSKDVVQETLVLVHELMPALPKDGIFDPRAHMHRSSRSKVKKEDIASERAPEQPLNAASSSALPGISSSRRSPQRSPQRSGRATPVINDDGSLSIKREEATPALEGGESTSLSTSAPATLSGTLSSMSKAKESAQDRRVQLFVKLSDGGGSRKATVNRFFALLLPILLDVYSASVGIQVRTKAFQSMLKIVQYCQQEDLLPILTIVPMASFLASCFSSRDHLNLAIDALQMTELLLTKIPDTYQFFFRREGVLHEIEKMASEALVMPSKKKASSSSSTPAGSSTPTLGNATPVDDGGDTGDLGTRLGPIMTPVAAKAISTADAVLMDSITLRARHLKKLLTDTSSDGSSRADSSLEKIRKLVRCLETASEPEASRADAEKIAGDSLRDVATLFSDANAMSSFEMQESGLIGGLLRFATGGKGTRLHNEQRRNMVMQAFMGSAGSSEAAFTSLVKRLQEALGRAEESEVVTALPSGGDSRQNPATMLARQLKIRLIAVEDSGIPKGVANVVVSIHAIATFQAFNDYLRPRITTALAAEERARTGGAGSSSPGASRLSGVLAAFAAATGLPAADLENVAAGLAGSSGPESPLGSSRPSSAVPTRRRSSRLSARANAANETPPSRPASRGPSDASGPAHTPLSRTAAGREVQHEDSPEIVDDGLEAAGETAEERPVNFEVASDGSRVSARTPDGTRIQTPVPGSAIAAAPGTSSRLAVPSSSTGTPAAASGSSAPPAARSYAAALKTAPSDWHLEFSMDGKDIDLETTIFGAVYQHEIRSGTQLSTRGVWHNIYTVAFKKVPGAPPKVDALATPEPPDFETALPEFLSKDPRQATVLRLLDVLHQINSEWAETVGKQEIHDVEAAAALASNLFVNNKLTAKLNRQLEEPMIVASNCLPDWALELPVLFPFLFPFESRYIFLQSTSFGYARLMQKWLQSARTDTNSRRDENLSFLGRLQRQKVRISRQRLFESAFKVFELYGSSKALLEVEYFDEVGTGLGPTLEFYSLVSKEFRQKSLRLWREGDSPPMSEFVSNSRGLFPAPVDSRTLDTEDWTKLCNRFKVLGTVVAKALMDSRIIDLPFNKMFMRLILNQHIPLTIASVQIVDPALAQSLEHIEKYVEEKKVILACEGISDEDKQAAIGGVEVDGAAIGDLSLDFTLPGYDVELKEGGREVELSMENVEEYISLVVEWTLVKGIKPIVQKFKEGFSEVFPVRDLHTFTPEELVLLFGNEEEDWSVETITESVKADHGFSITSRTIVDLIDIISKYDGEMRRKFLSFATGSTRLPIGGFKGLNPRLTVVRKNPEDGASPDSLLPSVMTCASFLKICEYSSKEVLEQRLATAVLEGAGAFHLS